MKNPCRDCERLDKDKNGPECTDCRRRIDYIRRLGGFPAPREMSTMENVDPINTPEPLAAPPAASRRKCGVPGCNGKYIAKGLCSHHYEKKRK